MAPFRKVLSRARARLAGFGLEPRDTPTHFIAIFNGGVLNNISQNILQTFISKISKSSNFQLFMPKKSYAIAKFESIENATNFVEFTQKSENTILDSKSRQISVIGFFITNAPQEDLEILKFEKPNGFQLFDNFISDEEEEILIKLVKMRLLDTNGELRNRAVVHFGHEFDYTTNR